MSVFGGAMGAMAAAGLWMVVVGAMRPRRKRLAEALKELNAPDTEMGMTSRQWAIDTLEARTWAMLKDHDLELVNKTRTEVLTQAVVVFAAGCAITVVAAGAGLAGLLPAKWLFVGLCLAGAVAGPWSVVKGVASTAEKTREEIRAGLVVWMEFVSQASSFYNVEQAAQIATRAGGEAFGWFAAALEDAQVYGQRAWEGLARFGAKTRIREVVDAAQALEYAGVEGARMKEALTARAATAAAVAAAEELAAANKNSARIQMPIGLTTMSIVGLLLYPAYGLLAESGL